MIKELEGFKKIQHNGGILVECVLYNPETKQVKRVIVDDYDHQYGDGCISREFTLKELEEIRFMPIDEEALFKYNIDHGIPCRGAVIEVAKGRKYPIGERGIIRRIYDVKDRYGRKVATYCETDNGMKIDIRNIRVVGGE